ncbi:ABC transporter permease [Rhodovastum atsumiense]|uniref:ABC transporter permease n=1 Tax=Rhodovastum atsumiense TaxID=504468 RepID=A0A5M6ITH9_9PROT|nr:ABC transporter permease [Rhodovastum atsumiense]KAA5610755.1 ABC transporter permease [Rhodovastum atsumiense]CAH2604405.1 ABC transporter permease [Rhodovastum atsumiense]
MIPLPLAIALAHLRMRRRQTLVSVLGVTLGVGVFISMTGLMQGFQSYFRNQIIETNPHVTITDETRRPAPQPLQMLHPAAAVQVARIVPRDPVRGISAAGGILDALAAMPGLDAAPTLRGQLLLRRAGRDFAVTALGIDPVRELRVTTLQTDMVQGSIEALGGREDGIVLGITLANRMGVALGDTIAVATPANIATTLRVVGIFRTGLEQQDTSQVLVNLTKQQSMQARPRVVNEIHIRLADISRSIPVAAALEGRWGYKAAPWEETYARILDVFVLQNAIMFFATGAVLVVAAFGIFNIISTVVMEKARDIAILRSIGFASGDVVAIFVIEGVIVGLLGISAGALLGWLLSAGLAMVPAPGATDPSETLRIARAPWIYGVAATIAFVSALAASWLPARRAARSDPLTIIRGAM